MAVAEDIGCDNPVCMQREECERQVIWTNGTARETKRFGGTPEKGCGKFIPIKEKSESDKKS
jgi:hypothetical protein